MKKEIEQKKFIKKEKKHLAKDELNQSGGAAMKKEKAPEKVEK